MTDSDIFFSLTADRGNQQAQTAIRLPYNRRWLLLGEGNGEDCVSDSRYSTPAPDLLSDTEEAYGGALVIKFSTLTRARNSGTLPPFNRGLLLGTDPESCHVLLPRGPGISARHCGLHVDQHLRLYLQDFSRFGTAVRCNNYNENQVRQGHRWFLTKPVKEQPLFRDIAICVNRLKIRVEFPNHGTTTPEYERNLQAFLKTLVDDTDSFAALRIDSLATTVAPSGSITPLSADIYYRLHRLGKGTFASVYQAVQARSGELFAMKVFMGTDKRRSDSQQPKWLEDAKREFTIMRNHRHPNVVQVFDFLKRDHSLAIVMEYYPDGNIEDVQLSEVSYMSAAGQLLDGLQHLHNCGITHRDLKPANILIQLFPLKVVIADFGLSKITISPSSLKTFCGSLKYAAPEIFQNRSYGTKADMWSWGVVTYRWIYKTPKEPKHPKNDLEVLSWSERWSSRLRNALDDEEECRLVTLLSSTITDDLEQRWTAQECLGFGFAEPPLFRRRNDDNMVVCVNADEEVPVLRKTNSTAEQTPIRHPIEQQETLTVATTQSHLSSRSIFSSEDFVYGFLAAETFDAHIEW